MIFDHGCDCFNSVLNAMAISKMFGVSLNIQAIAVVMVVAAFYFTTLEQYFTHYFYLPRINNVNEGIVLLVILAWIGAATSGQIWRWEFFEGIPNFKPMLAVLILSTQGAVLVK